MIKVILWDVDGTLLDFEAAEKAAIRQCFASHGMGECSDEMLKRYPSLETTVAELTATITVHSGEGTVVLAWANDHKH